MFSFPAWANSGQYVATGSLYLTSPRSARRCNVVATTPFVVEKLIDIVSRSHGRPATSRVPPHTSTTFSPW